MIALVRCLLLLIAGCVHSASVPEPLVGPSTAAEAILEEKRFPRSGWQVQLEGAQPLRANDDSANDERGLAPANGPVIIGGEHPPTPGVMLAIGRCLLLSEGCVHAGAIPEPLVVAPTAAEAIAEAEAGATAVAGEALAATTVAGEALSVTAAVATDIFAAASAGFVSATAAEARATDLRIATEDEEKHGFGRPGGIGGYGHRPIGGFGPPLIGPGLVGFGLGALAGSALAGGNHHGYYGGGGGRYHGGGHRYYGRGGDGGVTFDAWNFTQENGSYWYFYGGAEAEDGEQIHLEAEEYADRIVMEPVGLHSNSLSMGAVGVLASAPLYTVVAAARFVQKRWSMQRAPEEAQRRPSIMV